MFVLSCADTTFSVIQMRCQRSNAVMDPRWSSLGEFVLTAGLPDDSRPGCWPCKCRPPFSGMSVSSFEPPSLEISSSSHHSWRLLLLFKPPPLPWAASLDSVKFIVLRLLPLVGSWCDKCGFARGSLRKVVSIACERERALSWENLPPRVNSYETCWLDPLEKDSALELWLYLSLLLINNRWLLLWFHSHLSL